MATFRQPVLPAASNIRLQVHHSPYTGKDHQETLRRQRSTCRSAYFARQSVFGEHTSVLRLLSP